VNRWGSKSSECRSTTSGILNKISDMVLIEMDISQVYGHRTEEEQNKLYEKGYSKVKFPNSGHNKSPSIAGDYLPPNSNSLENFCRMRELFYFYAGQLGVELRPLIIFSNGSGDWGHIELAE
jgi:hypothetical protein